MERQILNDYVQQGREPIVISGNNPIQEFGQRFSSATTVRDNGSAPVFEEKV